MSLILLHALSPHSHAEKISSHSCTQEDKTTELSYLLLFSDFFNNNHEEEQLEEIINIKTNPDLSDTLKNYFALFDTKYNLNHFFSNNQYIINRELTLPPIFKVPAFKILRAPPIV